MKRIAFNMQLHKGCEHEYARRHEQLWPELKALLKSAGITDYSIFLDESSGTLFATLIAESQAKLDALPAEPVMKKWWAYMRDIMDTNADDSPVTHPLKKVFYLP